MVAGKADSGDYLVPAGNGFAMAVKPSAIGNFADYKRVLGTAWESKDLRAGRIRALVGKK